MRTGVLLASAVLALLAALWWLLPGGGARPAAEPIAPAPVADAPARGARAVAAGEEHRASAGPQLATPAAPEPAAEPEQVALRVEARVLGSDQRPLQGAQLAIAGVALVPAPTSDAAGRLLAQLSAEQRAALGEGPIAFEVRAPRHELLLGERALPGGPSLHLGDLRLAPGGTLRGVVQDEAALPVAGAQVVVARAQPLLPEQEALRRRSGPPVHLRRALPPGDWEQTRSDADGRFAVPHLGQGHWMAWAQEGDREWAWSAAVALDASGADELLVVLGPPAPERWIRGRLLEPQGTPVAAVSVQARALDETAGGFAGTGEDGAFALLVEPGRDYRLWADSPQWQWTQAVAEPVRPGAGDVELRFGMSAWFFVRVRDPRGNPVGRGRAVGLRPGSERGIAHMAADLWQDGRTILRRPDEPFLLRVEAPGFRSARLGPLEPATIEGPVDVVLEPGPALRGRVVDAQGPLAGAHVSLRGIGTGGRLLVASAWKGEGEPFVHRFGGLPIQMGSTDEQGRFELAVPPRPEKGPLRTCYLLAEAAGATQFEGPLQIDPDLGLEGVELRLGPGGELRGTLALIDGRAPAGWTVRASDGCGGLREQQLGPDGAFAFERMRPGDWEVRAFPPGAHFSATQVSHCREACAPRPDARVQEGGVAELELLVAVTSCRLTGQLTIAGAAPGAWKAALSSPRWSDQCALAPDGSFVLEGAASEGVKLTLSSAEPRWQHLIVRDTLHLPPGPSSWACDLRPGTVRGFVAPATALAQEGPPHLLWLGPGELRAQMRVRLAEDGTFGPYELPAGEIRVLRNLFAGTADYESPLLRAHLRAGETLELRVP